jgi:hypothetical protein
MCYMGKIVRVSIENSDSNGELLPGLNMSRIYAITGVR